ncbi:MAG TPA: flagellar biosynthesis protein FlhF [Steroidobacteraceae bacterium]|jgi:flagellar biosynthesis protein FlhF|nr:flagellar biosynthesis protein FlhF [Steroidobacteraceae bacterium]
MKIKHYRAADMRQALRQVREAQGPDAVILSSRRIANGVEVVAAVDYDVDVADSDVGSEPSRTESRIPTAADYAALAQRFSGNQEHQEISDLPPDANEELRTLRRMLETQLATLAWNDLSRRAPIQTELLRQLTVLGLAHDLAGELVSQLPQRMELAEAQRLSLALMARRIETVGERWMEGGGVVALVGPTGVGKTTLIAKLAARWVLRNGARDLALISTDSIRIGAQEQIHTLGRLLGVPAYAIDGAGELAETLDHIGERRLVLIDSAGLSQRDPRLATELETLANASDRLESSLVLSAAAQAGAIEQSLERFAAARPTTCCVTKLDEATSLGGTLSALIRTKLPLAYLSDGQQVPEDLSPARSHQLIARAVELSKKAGAHADEDLLQRRFGAVAHALA